ncbi:hypothetical protein ABKV19_017126 [Rosa sericea]
MTEEDEEEEDDDDDDEYDPYHGGGGGSRTNIQMNEEVAIKLVSNFEENVKTKHPQLLYESKLYRILATRRNWDTKCAVVWS